MTEEQKVETQMNFDLQTRCVNTIRVLAADMVQKANSGHPGAPMGCAPIAHLLFSEVMNFNGKNPHWTNRDRFVLSNGHACALLYSMLHLSGYELSLDDLKKFRQIDSLTPGHPENFLTAGVEVSTGPLGQGISNAVGLALGEANFAARYNREGFNIVDHYTYVICGDGCLQEGIASEACSLAGHLGLGKLIVLYDDNSITIDGETSLSFTEDVAKRFESYGWHVQYVEDGTNLDALRTAVHTAQRVVNQPSLIKVKTIIGYGSANEGKEVVHGAPLGSDDLASVKRKFGFDDTQSFVIPPEVAEFYAQVQTNAQTKEAAWIEKFDAYSKVYPELAQEFVLVKSGVFPDGWRDRLPRYTASDKADSTRKLSQKVLNVFAETIPQFIGGSADLTGSNATEIKSWHDFQKHSPSGKYIRFGVREHAMAAISNGLYAYGGYRPFCATFLNFIGYALGAVRLSALSRFPVLYVMTHDTIALGEDGPTHQPIESLEIIRSMPNINLLRPADGNEVSGAYIVALQATTTPSVICLTRQNLPHLAGSSVEKVALGAYTIFENEVNAPLELVLVSTGSEVHITIEAAKLLNHKVRVVSMPCAELFDQQSLEYQLELFPVGVPVMSVEASSLNGWHKYAHAQFGMIRFGASGPMKAVMEKFGFTPSNISQRAQEVIQFYAQNGPAPSLINVPRFHLLGSH